VFDAERRGDLAKRELPTALRVALALVTPLTIVDVAERVVYAVLKKS